MSDDSSIKALLIRFVDGENEAYSALYIIFSKDLYLFGLSYCSNRDLVEDAVQDVFVEIYTRRNSLKEIKNFKFYLFTSFKNRLIQLMKKESYLSRIERLDESDLLDAHIEDVLIEKEEEMQKKERCKNVLMDLNSHQREAISYRFVENFTYEEIGVLMCMNLQSVKNLVHRAIKKIRQLSNLE